MNEWRRMDILVRRQMLHKNLTRLERWHLPYHALLTLWAYPTMIHFAARVPLYCRAILHAL